MTTLYLFAKIRPLLLVPHAMTLQPYLSLRCRTQGDYQIISDVARTLEVVVPLLEHPSESFLAQLEEDAVKLILQHDKAVVAACLSCLGSVVNHVTRNFKLIRDCFRKYFGPLTEYKLMHERDPDNPRLVQHRPFFRRALFTVGLLLRHFDFTDEEVRLQFSFIIALQEILYSSTAFPGSNFKFTFRCVPDYPIRPNSKWWRFFFTLCAKTVVTCSSSLYR